MPAIDADDVDEAAKRLDGISRRTPLELNERLSELVGGAVWLKREDVQVVRSYKLHGAYNLMAQLQTAARTAGVVCASAGNHAQGVAWACREAGLGYSVRPAPGAVSVCIVSGGNNDVSGYSETPERALQYEGLKHYFLVDFPQQPRALRRFLGNVLGPGDDITLFEYVKRNNRELGPALVGIELSSANDLAALLARMAGSPISARRIEPEDPLFRFVL